MAAKQESDDFARLVRFAANLTGKLQSKFLSAGNNNANTTRNDYRSDVLKHIGLTYMLMAKKFC
eukprot:scaffold195689_cov41-Prasinocladus_malaysianus.AAC.1